MSGLSSTGYAVLLLGVPALAGCGGAAGPEDPVWNKQPCDHCHMIVSEPRYAAQLVRDDGRHLFFDDVGCLAAYLDKQKPAKARAFVREGTRWSDALAMHYASGAQTPMGYGFVADPHGPLDFGAVRSAVASRGAPGATP